MPSPLSDMKGGLGKKSLQPSRPNSAAKPRGKEKARSQPPKQIATLGEGVPEHPLHQNGKTSDSSIESASNGTHNARKLQNGGTARSSEESVGDPEANGFSSHNPRSRPRCYPYNPPRVDRQKSSLNENGYDMFDHIDYATSSKTIIKDFSEICSYVKKALEGEALNFGSVWHSPVVESLVIDIPNRTVSKSSTSAKECWSFARFHYQTNENYRALQSYNDALLYCPGESEFFLPLIQERAALLRRLGFPELSIRDIDWALSLAWSNSVVVRERLREDRKESCLAIEYDKALVKKEAADDLARKKLEQKLRERGEWDRQENSPESYSPSVNLPPVEPSDWPNIPEVHESIPNATSLVSLKWRKNRRMHFVANSLIEAGNVILREEPLSTGVKPDLHMEVCQTCLRYLEYPRQLIPCGRCYLVCYCSLECRASPWNPHNEECSILSLLISLPPTESTEEFYHVFRLVDAIVAKAEEAALDPQVYSDWMSNIFSPLGYLNLSVESSSVGDSAEGNGQEMPKNRLREDVMCRAVYILKVLMLKYPDLQSNSRACRVLEEVLTTVLSKREKSSSEVCKKRMGSKKKKGLKGGRRKQAGRSGGGDCGVIEDETTHRSVNVEVLLGTFLYRLLCSPIRTWGFDIEVFNLRRIPVASDWQSEPIGFGLYPLATLLTHDCFPNCVVTFKEKQLVVTAVRCIPAGGTVTVSRGGGYDTFFAARDVNSRRRTLLQFLGIEECKCRPCEQNWPLVSDLPEIDEDKRELVPLQIASDALDEGRCDVVVEKIFIRRLAHLETVFERATPSFQYLSAVDQMKRVIQLRGNCCAKLGSCFPVPRLSYGPEVYSAPPSVQHYFFGPQSQSAQMTSYNLEFYQPAASAGEEKQRLGKRFVH